MPKSHRIVLAQTRETTDSSKIAQFLLACALHTTVAPTLKSLRSVWDSPRNAVESGKCRSSALLGCRPSLYKGLGTISEKEQARGCKLDRAQNPLVLGMIKPNSAWMRGVMEAK